MCSSEKFDVAIVGGGPAGLSAAYHLAKMGFDVVLLERGKDVGCKNVFGGRVYAKPFIKYFESFMQEAPIERWVSEERLSLTWKDMSVDLTLHHSKNKSKGSFTVFLTKLVNWLATLVESHGGIVATGSLVNSLLVNEGIVSGVMVNGERILADYVIIAEGSNGYLLEQHKLLPTPISRSMAVGVKEVIRLGKEKIDERFGDGVAWLFAGEVTEGVPGGAFLYTMKEYVSIGVVIRLSHVHRLQTDVKDIVEVFRHSDRVKNLLRGGTLVEYQAKTVREISPINAYRNLIYGNGYLIVGEAAGTILNTGFTIHGVDFAVESGRIAAEAVEAAHAEGKNDKKALSIYEKKLLSSEIYASIMKYRRIMSILEQDDTYTIYPKIICKLMDGLYDVEAVKSPKEAIKQATKDYSLFRLFMALLRVIM